MICEQGVEILKEVMVLEMNNEGLYTNKKKNQ